MERPEFAKHFMTSTQDDILDELYFVTSFKELQKTLELPEKTLCQELQKLLEQEFVKCFFPDPDTEITFSPETFEQACGTDFYLATKKGLLAHNSR